MFSCFGQSHKCHTHITGILGNLRHIFKLWCLAIVDAVSFCVLKIFLVFDLKIKWKSCARVYYKHLWSNTLALYFKPFLTLKFFTQKHACALTPEHKSGSDGDTVSSGIKKACLVCQTYIDMMSLFSSWTQQENMKDEHNTGVVPLCLSGLMADAFLKNHSS